jgi:hypothetical protein
MKIKLIAFSDQQIDQILKDSSEREISFTEMVRRIIDTHYEEWALKLEKKVSKTV